MGDEKEMGDALSAFTLCTNQVSTICTHKQSQIKYTKKKKTNKKKSHNT